jgi:hypothetical protein
MKQLRLFERMRMKVGLEELFLIAYSDIKSLEGAAEYQGMIARLVACQEIYIGRKK